MAVAAVGGDVIQSFGWNGSGWVPACSAVASERQELRLATMNILADCFPWVVRLAIASEERFGALCKEIETLDATVLALNEVTANSLECLLSSPYVREQYYVTELPDNRKGTIQPHGCVILSKLPFVEAYRVQPEESLARAPIVGVFSVATRRVAVCALHTTAEQTPRNRAIRVTQIARANAFLISLHADGGHHIVGDLNLHYLCEDGVALESQLLDLWAETHFGSGGDQEAGFTFDAQTNTMIPRYIPAERRRMRLDRMLCSKGGCLVPDGPVRLWGDMAVDARRDVFLSDHYGLVVDLKVAPDGLHGDEEVEVVLKRNGQIEMEDSGFSVLRFAAALTYHVPWLTLRAAGLW